MLLGSWDACQFFNCVLYITRFLNDVFLSEELLQFIKKHLEYLCF